jgi:hypothetical protein
MNRLIIISAVSFLGAVSSNVSAGSYVFAGDPPNENLVTHPTGYLGSGGRINVSVCIDPTSTITAPLVQPVKNIVETWNQLNPVTGNLLSFGNNNIPNNSDYDWESVTLHEVGHCIGLAHPNLGSQTGVTGNDTNYTNTTKGVDGVFDFDDGADNIIGSRDDNRDDDINLFWFNDNINNPFVLTPPYDQTKYTRNLNDLPNGHNYAANSDRTVGAALGFASSESVMQQATFNDEDQRRLGIDDVASIKFAMSGVDQVHGTADDYTYRLTYGGIASNCDINIKHDASYPGFAVCNVSGFFIGNSDHLRISAANISVNPSAVSWFFNQDKNDLIYKDGHEY